MKCCSPILKNRPIKNTSNNTTIPPTSTIQNKFVTFQIDSGFCPYCGVDVFLFSHEFWCQLSTEDEK